MDQVPKGWRRHWITPRMMRYVRRGGVVIGGALALFSFVLVDLARNDAVFTASLDLLPDNTPPIAEFTLSNSSSNPMTSADINFALYDADGRMIATQDEDGAWGTAESTQFAPRGMTIGEASSKFGPLAEDVVARPLGDIQDAWICAIFDGSFWIDRVRTEYRLSRGKSGGPFGQTEHETSVHFLGPPNCTPPKTLSP